MGTYCGETAENKQIIAAATKEDHIWSSKKIEDGGLNLNTMECLRGRLLAERQASRVAKVEVESLGKRLVELEKLLRLEIKLRDKAERKLKFLKKKLESLNNTSSMSGQSELSDSSEKCENSCGSSSVSSVSKHSEANEAKHSKKNPALSENAVHNHNVSEDCNSQITDNSSCNSEPGYAFPQILREKSSEDLKNDESRHSSLSSKSSVTENEEDHGNSLAY